MKPVHWKLAIAIAVAALIAGASWQAIEHGKRAEAANTRAIRAQYAPDPDRPPVAFRGDCPTSHPHVRTTEDMRRVCASIGGTFSVVANGELECRCGSEP